MMRQKTTKELARQIEPGYIRRRSGLRLFRGVLSFFFVAAAVAWWSIGGTDRRDAMINPGHVSTAHAMWENNCAVCHDSDGKGGFRQAVSDSACLQCHSAAMHHPNQLLLDDSNAGNDLVLAVNDTGPKHPGLRSANCVACHVEHRGRESLAAVNDATCTKCHANINAALKEHAVRTVSTRVTSFDPAGGHVTGGRPYFLSALTTPTTLPSQPATPDAPPVDPTHLKFSHAQHMTGSADPAGGACDNCTYCHGNRTHRATEDGSLADAAPAAQSAASSSVASALDGNHIEVMTGDSRYIRPISYQRDCATACHAHELRLPGGAVLPHARLDLVLDRLAPIAGAPPRIEDFYKNWLARQSAAKQHEILQDKTADQWATDSAGQFRGTQQEWLSGVKDGSLPGAAALEKALIALPDETKIDPAEAGKDIRVTTAWVAYGMTSKCVTCHTMKEIAPASLASTASTAPATSAATTEVSSDAAPQTQAATTLPTAASALPLLTTAPTGIPDAPGRWFVQSIFDHQAHQNIRDQNLKEMVCVTCHAGAKQSTSALDLLSPNLTNWSHPSGSAASCAQCHHAPTEHSRGARAGCVTCHTFHDRSVSPGRDQ